MEMEMLDFSDNTWQSGRILVPGDILGNITFFGGRPGFNIPEQSNVSSRRMCPYAPLLMTVSEITSEITAQYENYLRSIIGTNMIYPFPINGTYFNGTNTQVFCSKQYYFSEVSKYLFLFIAIFFGLIAVIGNLLVLGISHFEKSFQSPIFVTLQSLSAVSLLNIIFVYVTLFLDCKIELLLGKVACYIKVFCLQFSKNMIPIHLCLLSGLRLFMTISPLKYHSIVTKSLVCRMIACLCIAFVVFEIILMYFGLIYCFDSREWHTIIVTGITAVMFVLTTLISFVQQKSNKLQSKNHRRQSNLASIVIVLFAMIYCPVTIVLEVMYLTCYSNTFVYILIQWLYQISQFILFAINPIILFLRNDSAKKKILTFCCTTYMMNKEKSSSKNSKPLPA